MKPPPDTFGWLTVITSQVAFWAAVFSFGFSGYFLGHIKEYIQQEKHLTLLPAVTTFIAVVAYTIFFDADIFGIAFSCLLVSSTLSSSFVLDSQIKKKPYFIAIYQGVPTLIKSVTVLIAYAVFLVSPITTTKQTLFVFEVVFITASCMVVLVQLAIYFRQTRVGRLDNFKLVFLKKGEFYGSWISVVASFAFATAIPGLVAYKTDAATSAYLGIYMIFWSILSTLIVSLVTNKYMYQIAHAIGSSHSDLTKTLFAEATKVSWFVTIPIFVITLVLAYILSERIWPQLGDIKIFLIFVSAILVLKSVQSVSGMIVGFPRFIKKKVIIQLASFALFCALLLMSRSPDIVDIAGYLFVSEFILSLCFYLYCKVALKLV